MNPKYIFSAFFAVASLLSIVLPQISHTTVAPAAISAPASQAVVAAASQVQSVAVEIQPAVNEQSVANEQLAAPDSAANGSQTEAIPLTAFDQSAQRAGLPDLQNFTTSVANSQPGLLVGVYVPGLFAFPVVQQPSGNNDYVSPVDFTLTQYGAAAQYGSIAILAHNYLGGRSFFNLIPGLDVVLVYGDGRQQRFRIEEVERYQALDSSNPYSDFINVTDPFSQVLPFNTVFDHFYTESGQVVFQTCIKSNGDPSWGRIFIVARPL